MRHRSLFLLPLLLLWTPPAWGKALYLVWDCPSPVCTSAPWTAMITHMQLDTATTTQRAQTLTLAPDAECRRIDATYRPAQTQCARLECPTPGLYIMYLRSGNVTSETSVYFALDAACELHDYEKTLAERQQPDPVTPAPIPTEDDASPVPVAAPPTPASPAPEPPAPDAPSSPPPPVAATPAPMPPSPPAPGTSPAPTPTAHPPVTSDPPGTPPTPAIPRTLHARFQAIEEAYHRAQTAILERYAQRRWDATSARRHRRAARQQEDHARLEAHEALNALYARTLDQWHALVAEWLQSLEQH